MGEYADMAVDDDLDRLYDADDYDDRGLDWCVRRRRRTLPTCERCGRANLLWGETDDGWRLFEDAYREELHDCSVATADDFEALP